jgi:DNA helicase-2/ATP-dependent DNA helicase PcrA
MIALLEKILRDGKEKENEILVITFSRKAVGEIRERLARKIENHSIKIYTFHAYCLSVIQRYHPDYREKKAEILPPEEKEKVLKGFLKEHRFTIGGIPYEFLLSEKGGLLKKYFPDLQKEMFLKYAEYKKIHKKLDFSDLVRMYIEGLEAKEEWASNARREVKRVIVDEFQDTDLEQLKWLQLLAPEKLTVVGDDWQAIYGFRGASTEPFLKFGEFFSPCKQHFLTTNYRSLPEIIKTAAIPISKNKKNISKLVKPFRKGKANVFKIELIEMEDWVTLIPLLEKFSDTYILCRSNYRISQLNKIGFPKEKTITIHASKGLEFGTVIVDITDGWNVDQDIDKDGIEEERRILYVALSRAKDNLLIVGNKEGSEDRLETRFFAFLRKKLPEFKVV